MQSQPNDDGSLLAYLLISSPSYLFKFSMTWAISFQDILYLKF